MKRKEIDLRQPDRESTSKDEDENVFLSETQRSAREKVWDTSRRWASLDQMKSLAHQTLLEKIRLAQKEPVDNFSAGWLA